MKIKTRTVELDITEELIQQGLERKSDQDVCCYCPIAIALQKVTNNPEFRVGLGYFWVIASLGMEKLPVQVEQWIKLFDKYYDGNLDVRPSPIILTLEVPDEYFL